MMSSAILLLVTSILSLWMFADGSPVLRYSDTCTCDGALMRCKNVIPKTVPNNVNELILSLFNSSLLSPGIFCNVSWDNITKLFIDDTGSVPFFLDNYVFMCLKQIQVLKLYTENYIIANNNSLYGLENVSGLDFSGCDRLGTNDLIILLSVQTNIVNLKKLLLSNIGKLHDGIEISQNLIDVLSDKDIIEIDLSNTPISGNNPDLNGLCDTVKTLNLSHSSLNKKSHFLVKTCRSLRNLDVYSLAIPHNIPHNISCINLTIPLPLRILGGYQFYQYLTMLNLSRVTFNAKYFYIQNCSVIGLPPVSFNWKELRFSGYNIPSLDGRIINLLDQLQYIDISDNRMETIGAKTLKSFKYLKKIDLSKNKLSQTHLFEETFSDIFKNNSLLEEINLNDNGLYYLPSKIFDSNIYLKRIDISSNLITQITFNVSCLIHLDSLDMRNNSIHQLDETSRRALDSLYERHQRRKNNSKQNTASTILIDLRANPFLCMCDSLQFLKWFVASPIFTATRHQYHCKADGQEIEMNMKAVEAAEDDCERPKRKLRKLLLSSVIPTLSASLLALAIIYVVKRYRKYKFYQRLGDQVGLLRDDEIGFRFPVFLSFSSHDSEFVIPNVLNPLKEHLQRIADTDRNLVCDGDSYFRLGRSIFSEIITCLQDCAVVVVVMSRNYCRSDYCKLEIEQSRLMNKPIIIIVKEEVYEEEMNTVTKEIFRHFTRIRFILEDGQVRLQRDWEDVCLSIIQLL